MGKSLWKYLCPISLWAVIKENYLLTLLCELPPYFLNVSNTRRQPLVLKMCLSFQNGSKIIISFNSVKTDYRPSEKGSTLKGKNLLPFGANSIHLDQILSF